MAIDLIEILIRQQDGSVVALKVRDTFHNRQIADYIRRHEAFAK